MQSCAAETQLTVDCSKKQQTIVGFGTCGMHWTGGDLYTKDMANLYVNDLGASVLRFSVSPSVLTKEVPNAKDIDYKNFTIDKNNQDAINYVASVYAANPKEMTVIATIWSPPGWMKTNGKTSNGGSLRADRVEHYAKYLAEWVRYMKEVAKTPIHAVSIQNELSFAEPYDSCQYTAARYSAAVLATCDAFKNANLDS